MKCQQTLENAVVLTRTESQRIDHQAIEEFGIPAMVLMENAGRGIADFLQSRYTAGTIVICCGKGNNAGDGFVVARHLDGYGIPVQVLLCASPDQFTKETQINYGIAVKSEISMVPGYLEHNVERAVKALLNQATWIVDALLGIGLTGAVKAPYDTIIQAVNASPAKVLAIDIPSGLDCDSGNPLGATIQADETLTCMAMKKGFLNPHAQPFLGTIHVVPIGIPRILFANYQQRLY